MSNYNRRNKLDIPDGEYPVIAAIQGQLERTYILRVKNGFPSLLFPVVIPNYPYPYHSLELRSESIEPVPTRDGTLLFRVAVELPNPLPLIGLDRPKQADFESIYIALNLANNDQVALKRGKHLIFATKGRVAWRAPLNFLMDYFYHVIGKEWLEAQTESSHPLTLLLEAVHAEISSAPSESQGDKNVPVDNPVFLWFLDFSFNLFIVATNQKLEDRSIRRLRDPNNFWSTVHEIFVASLFLCNGFEIRLEDEEDGSSRHSEFVAVHKTSNAEFAVEAKLANQSIFSETMDFRKWKSPKGFRFRRLLNDAFEKHPKQPLVIVLDLNRLPNSDMHSQQAFNNYMYREINNISPDNGERDKWSRIEFVNRPFLLSAAKGAALVCSRCTIHSANSVYEDSPIEAVWALNTVFRTHDFIKHIERLGQHLNHILADTPNRFWMIGPRHVAFSPKPPD